MKSPLPDKLPAAHDLIIDLVAQNARLERENAELADQNARLDQANAELREKLEKQKRARKRQAHPFRRQEKKRIPPSKHKKSGRRKGKGTFARRPAPERADEESHISLQSCPHCGNSELPAEKKEFANWQIDIPPIQPVVTCFHTEGCICPQCKTWIQSRHPSQLSTAMGAANITFGPRLIAIAADLHEHLGVSYEKLEDLLSSAFNFDLERSSLCKAVDRLLKQAEPIYSQLIDLIRQSSVVQADETGWRIGILNAWLWTFTNKQATVYEIRAGKGARSHQVVVDILGKEFAGVLVSDCFAAYDVEQFDDWLKQKCLAHFLRAFADLRDDGKAAVLAFAIEAIDHLKNAITLAQHRDSIETSDYQRQCAALEENFDAFLEQNASITNETATRLLNRLLKQRKHLFTFLYHPDVPADNNQAERDLRPAVVIRKTQGCNKTPHGARKHAVLTSISATLRKQNRSPIDFYTRLQFPDANAPPVTAPN